MRARARPPRPVCNANASFHSLSPNPFCEKTDSNDMQSLNQLLPVELFNKLYKTLPGGYESNSSNRRQGNKILSIELFDIPRMN